MPIKTTKIPGVNFFGGLGAITSTSDTLLSEGNHYISNSASLLTFTLPSVAAVGDTFAIAGHGNGGWRVNLNSGQFIHMGSKTQSDNVSVLKSKFRYDCIEITCTVANTHFDVTRFAGQPLLEGNYWGSSADGDVVISTNTSLPSTLDGEIVVKNYSSLTINSGVSLTTSNRCRGLWIYVNGDCTINGTISMTARGASFNPTNTPNTGLRIPRFKNSSTEIFPSSDLGTDVGVALTTAETYQTGINGNGKIYTACTKLGGAAGQAGSIHGGTMTNGSGGGGAGGGITNAAGAIGTCFSGGSGGGGGTTGILASAFGGAGGNGSGLQGGGGAGNPGGSPSGTGFAGNSGTGGLIVLIVKGNLTIGASGIISSNGVTGGYGDNGAGGSSGGGRILILYAGSLSNSGSIQANGGAAGYFSGAGGAGSITTDIISV